MAANLRLTAAAAAELGRQAAVAGTPGQMHLDLTPGDRRVDGAGHQTHQIAIAEPRPQRAGVHGLGRGREYAQADRLQPLLLPVHPCEVFGDCDAAQPIADRRTLGQVLRHAASENAVEVTVNGTAVFEGMALRTRGAIESGLSERFDPESIATAMIEIPLR